MVNKAVFAKQLEEDGGKVKSVNTLPVDYLHNTLCEPSRRTGLHIPMPRGLGKEKQLTPLLLHSKLEASECLLKHTIWGSS